MTQPAVFLDRDGVINPSVFRRGRLRAPLSVDEFQPFSWAAPSIWALRAAGFRCLVVTNQPDVAAGELDPAELRGMHERLIEEVGVDDVYACPHGQADGCACRKPSPGLVLAAAGDWDVDLGASFFIGDRASDIEAGRAAGCWTILVDGAENADAEPHHRAADLRGAVLAILTHTGAIR